MGYFIIVVFTTFLGSPPEFLPLAFKSGKDCENYLTKKVKRKYYHMRIETNEEMKYLVNYANDKFIVCKKLEYPNKQEAEAPKWKKTPFSKKSNYKEAEKSGATDGSRTHGLRYHKPAL